VAQRDEAERLEWVAGREVVPDEIESGIWGEPDHEPPAGAAPRVSAERKARPLAAPEKRARDLVREELLAAAGLGGRAIAARALAELPVLIKKQGKAAARAAALAAALRGKVGKGALTGQGSAAGRRVMIKLAEDLDGPATAVDLVGAPVLALQALGIDVDRRTARACWRLLAAVYPWIFSYKAGMAGIHLARYLAVATSAARNGAIAPEALHSSWATFTASDAGGDRSWDGVYARQTDQSIHVPHGPGGTKHSGRYRGTRAPAFNKTRPDPGVRGSEGGAEGLQDTPAEPSASGVLAGEGAGHAAAPSAGAEEAQPRPEPIFGHGPASEAAGPTASVWILRVNAMGSKWASLAAALVLDHESACPGWSAIGTATAVARHLLEAHVIRNRRAKPVRAIEVRNFAAGMQALADSGALLVKLDDAGCTSWTKPRAARAPGLELYEIEPRPVTSRVEGKVVVEHMPSDPYEIACSWMAQCKPPTDAQRLFLARLGIDASRLSRAEASVLQGKLHHRYHHLGLRHADLVWLLERHVGQTFALKCLAGEPHGMGVLLRSLRGWTASEIGAWRIELRALDRAARLAAVHPSWAAWSIADLRAAVDRYQRGEVMDAEADADEDIGEPPADDLGWATADIDEDAWADAELVDDPARAEAPAVNDHEAQLAEPPLERVAARADVFARPVKREATREGW
jgi:hypothetical protein